MDEPKKLLPIGAFASMTRLSIKALRLYDQLGLLQPRHIDQQSGYRYYDGDQLTHARMIRNLRDMDMPLATIRRVLTASVISLAQVDLLIWQYLSMRERQIEQIRLLARQFTQQLKPESNMSTLEVVLKDVPQQQIISITRRHTADGLGKQQEKDIGVLAAFAAEQGVEVSWPPFGIYHGPVSEQDDGPVETCIALMGSITGSGEIEAKLLEGGKAASVTILGEQCHYPELLAAYDTAADWIQKNGYETAQQPREVWYTGPGPDAKWEIVWLFKP